MNFKTLLFLISSTASFASDQVPHPPCQGLLLDDAIVHSHRQLSWLQRDPDALQLPLRRAKIISGPGHGQMEKADPLAPRPFVRADGKIEFRIESSGTQVIKADDEDDIHRGGVCCLKVETLIIRYADGRRMRGPYHTGCLPWDRVIVPFEESHPDGTIKIKYVGYAGAMHQPHLLRGAMPGAPRLPVVAMHNFTRSRHAYDITFERARRGFREVWTDRGSIFDHAPGTGGMWIDDQHEHGYGGRVVLNDQGLPWVDQWGYHWIIFDRVTEQKMIADALGRLQPVPYATEIRARRLKTPYRAFKKGELILPDGSDAAAEVPIINFRPSPTSTVPDPRPYAATDRGQDRGYLVEGANPIIVTIGDQRFWIISFSSGNYVDETYGTNLAFRTYDEGPIGPYHPITKVDGDLMDFGREFSKRNGISWGLARSDFWQDKRGDWWGIGHGILKSDLPTGYPASGWPNQQQFETYFRRQIIYPVSWSLQDGEPWLSITEGVDSE